MKKTTRYLVVATALMFGSVLVAPTVSAQDTQSTTPPTVQIAPTANPKDAGPAPTDAELTHFVDAAFQMRAASKRMRPKYDAAKTDADRAKIKQAVEAEMKTTVEHNKLTVKRYQQIFVAMRTDDDVRKKVEALVKQKQDK